MLERWLQDRGRRTQEARPWHEPRWCHSANDPAPESWCSHSATTVTEASVMSRDDENVIAIAWPEDVMGTRRSNQEPGASAALPFPRRLCQHNEGAA